MFQFWECLDDESKKVLLPFLPVGWKPKDDNEYAKEMKKKPRPSKESTK